MSVCDLNILDSKFFVCVLRPRYTSSLSFSLSVSVFTAFLSMNFAFFGGHAKSSPFFIKKIRIGVSPPFLAIFALYSKKIFQFFLPIQKVYKILEESPLNF